MRKVEDIIPVMQRIENVNDEIYICEYSKGFGRVGELLKEISDIMQDLIQYIPILKECGIDIPLEVVVGQLNNLIDAYEHKDTMMLWDTLNYEIKDTFEYYIEIIKEFEKQGVSI